MDLHRAEVLFLVIKPAGACALMHELKFQFLDTMIRTSHPPRQIDPAGTRTPHILALSHLMIRKFTLYFLQHSPALQ